jgi:propionyl-CoA carboxylase alpha chain
VFRKILIANRGEIALRVMRTCRAMGIETVAVYSDADRHALHTKTGDVAVRVASYLNAEGILDAARRTGAEAIHPGYGFLAENPEFAEACMSAGLVFIGPSPAAIRGLGSKIAARAVASQLGVPIVPHSAGFPLLIKASAGGGGRGMRVVRSAAELEEALESARREAQAAFGDGTVFLERYIEHARHVEVQIFGDHHGSVIHLFERDCSLQRRHQKVVEESPCPVIDDYLRARLCGAAVAIGRAAGYSSAGTVEFLVSGGEFFFLEVNTRIQVEHPVTEMVTGLDLIRLQIEVAEGKALPSQSSIKSTGHSIEARLYAEDPANSFLPSTGTLHRWSFPDSAVRVDSGVEQGTEVGIHYDPLLAKLIAHGPDRDTALRKLTGALRRAVAHGVTTNQDFLVRILESQAFAKSKIHTRFLDDAEFPAAVSSDVPFLQALAAYDEYHRHARRGALPGVPPNYRNNPRRIPPLPLALDGRQATFDPCAQPFERIACDAGSVTIETEGVQQRFVVTEVPSGEETLFYLTSTQGSRTIRKLPRLPVPKTSASQQTANSPMPGQVLRILVEPGQTVSEGDALVVLEAMKMEQTIRTTINGIVEAVLVQTGQVVAPGQTLVQIGSKEKADVHASA